MSAPRVVRDGKWKFRAVSGEIEVCAVLPNTNAEWGAVEDMVEGLSVAITAQRVAVWADLLANPNEVTP